MMIHSTSLRFLLLMLMPVSIILGGASVVSSQGSRADGGPQGTLKIVDWLNAPSSAVVNYAEGLVSLDTGNNFVPCLARYWRWVDECTIEFRLRKGVLFHNGEPFNADAVKLNWEAYKKMHQPTFSSIATIPDETIVEKIDQYRVRFSFPKPDALALVRIAWFFQFAPAYFQEHHFGFRSWGYLSEAGPWGTGPFEMIEGGIFWGNLSERIVLQAFDGYWDPRYPKLETVIFENTFFEDRDKALRNCREKEGILDIVSFISPLDTLQVAESPCAKVVKSRDFNQLHLIVNQWEKKSKWRDIRLRKALDYGLNRRELWQYGAKGNAYNLGGHIPPGARGHNPEIRHLEYNTRQAKSLLKDCGYPDGFALTLIAPETHKLEAKILKRMYERIDLKVDLEIYPWLRWQQKIRRPSERLRTETGWDVSICFRNDVYGHSGAAHLSCPFLEASGRRWIVYDPVYETMWTDMVQTLDVEKQDHKMQAMESYLSGRLYAIFVYSPLTLYAVNKNVNFVPQKSIVLKLKETSVSDAHWSVRSN